ncbi:autotransporter domain-containing protein [Erythrobacter rubeus]|uniref:Autotransporter domain-containing protein n=1 Tax=Erythrobacter rubeus TaxID=2760803 RepID=A0ABR8KNY5_9SPHN|nr:autotransporter domain-containing protein [Erythrobacter rubeus]MBD2840950.1 autotransporter domain-containing protein [Erythrobacter rubeus]
MNTTARRSGLLAAASALSLGFASSASANELGNSDTGTQPVGGIDISAMLAESAASTVSLNPGDSEDSPGIVVREGFDPNQFPPDGILDPENINGIGQMIIWNGDGTVGTCTGSLVNPRMVIFAAHCVNSRPQEAYGAAAGGVPISFGFQNDTFDGIIGWLESGFTTSVANAYYNAEHIWYDRRSAENPFGDFLSADVAIATLDTPAFDIPTWALLFTPLDGQEHVTVTGYGNTGVGTEGSVNSGGFRRRAAENYVSFLGSFDDRDGFLFGDEPGALPQNLYWTSFTDPSGTYDPDNGQFDFRLFGDDDVALPIEGSTGGGDSGGPLIVDQKYDIPVVAGVLSGGSRYFADQPFGSYGTHSFYQPLHAFWDLIVANNPYVYATNKAGIGEWTDPDHWVQAIDPNYVIDLDGELINRLPDARGAGITGDGAKFGELCFDSQFCTPVEQDAVVGSDGEALQVENGPGTENFVPNNVVGIPGVQRPRYFDVTLSAIGSTTLRDADIEIDRLTVSGLTKLNIASSGSLTTLGDFTQIAGWTNVDGILQARESFLLTGFLTGSGTLVSPFVTTGLTAIVPGGANKFGTLTIDGNLIMTSGSSLFIDASRRGSDTLAVTGLLSLSDPTDAGSVGPTLVFNKAGRAPRHGDVVTIATAGGGIEGTFGNIASFQGVLRPELTYGENAITAELRAGALVDIIGRKSRTARAFAQALDQLRDGFYDNLYDLYGVIDVMDGAALTATLDSLAPSNISSSTILQNRQSQLLSFAVNDRLSIMGSGKSGSLAIVGAPEAMRMGLASATGNRDVRMGVTDLTPRSGASTPLPEGFSGFISGGVFGSTDGNSAGINGGGQFGNYFGMGLERSVSDRASFGIALGYAEGSELIGSSENRSRTTQVSAYGAYDLGGNAYIGGVTTLETIDLDTQRDGFDGVAARQLNGASSMSRYAVSAEAGVNVPVMKGVTFTPRAQLSYDRLNLGGYQEQGTQTALAIDSLAMESVTARGGFKLAGQHQLRGNWSITPELRADYVRRVAGGNDDLTVRFAAADQVGIVLPLAIGEQSWSEVRGGVSVTNGQFSFGAGFETAIDRNAFRDDRATVEVGFRF